MLDGVVENIKNTDVYPSDNVMNIESEMNDQSSRYVSVSTFVCM